MVTYGVTPEGYVRKPQSVYLEEINQEQVAGISPEWDVSTESPVGQMNGIVARNFALLDEIAETAYNSNDPDKAEDFILTALAKLTGTRRQAADYSTVPLAFQLDIGLTLESGVHFVEDIDHPGSRWTPVEDFTAPSTGSHTTTFRAENTGPVAAAANKLTVIVTPVVGWSSPNNSVDATPGRDIEEDPELRLDREAQIANAAGATVEGIAAALSKLLTSKGITSGSVLRFENYTAFPDSNGLPPNSFEMVVWDGTDSGTAVTGVEIAQTIWGKKGSGAQPYGQLSAMAVDKNGTEQPVGYSRSAVLAIWLEFDLEVGADFDADDFKLGVATECDRLFTGGKPVLASRLVSIVWQQENIDNVVEVRLGLAVNPATDDDIPVGIRQIARFETTRIDVTIL